MRRIRHILILLVTTAVIGVLLAWSFHGVRGVYVCDQCGHLYAPAKGDPQGNVPAGTAFEEIPPGWACPECGAGRESFSPSNIRQAFRSARWGVVPLAFVMGMLVFLVKALRWQVLLAPVKRVGFRRLLSAIMIGFMVNCILSRLGEVVRAAVLGVKGEMRTATALASIALERIFDMCTVVLFLMLSLLWLHPSASGAAAVHLAHLRTAGVVLAMAFVVGVGFLVLLRVRRKVTTRFVLGCAAWLPQRLRAKVQDFLDAFLAGLDTIQGPRQVMIISLLSVVHWLCQVSFFYVMGYCFPGLGLSFPGAMLVFALTALSVAALPLPGYLGVFQGGVKAAALILALPALESFRYSWLTWAVNVPPIIAVGFVFLWSEGLTLGELRRRGK